MSASRADRGRTDRPLRARTVGLLGGSFNPAHGGHRRISLAVLAALDLAEVWWLVSPGNPLKEAEGMAPLAARVASARRVARRAPIRVTAIEREFGTRYTADTLRKLLRRWPRIRFVWIMGADNLAQFHRWKDWRWIARTVPIAVVSRPGYNRRAIAGPAMARLRRCRVDAARFREGRRSAPALILLSFMADHRSATALRGRDPDWADAHACARIRDAVTRRIVSGRAGTR
ncbi:nicotinate-nucleotide adenylyltransferase [Erythrobacteraceae bacterium CFH 75059]|uniref:nicotinate-nucleotide adenylyltransferase n=1 Tax=Qipengyuania thermophila TaxID=2509361 RepID=UPI00101FD72C|nr:nicotinate-nucleotide adenylyltransferase [Qipengyuania thermophila]TCD06716.1 nicotinate-nucleotide adenylyltransferase [Erythrobacteraceae bacterium CFH 75059]